MTNMLKALNDKADNLQLQMGNVSREMKTLRMKPKEMPEIKRVKQK